MEEQNSVRGKIFHVVDNDLICERLIMGSLYNGVCQKKISKYFGTICYKFSTFILVADSVLAVLTLLLVEAAV